MVGRDDRYSWGDRFTGNAVVCSDILNGRKDETEVWKYTPLGDDPEGQPATYHKLLQEASRRWETNAKQDVILQKGHCENTEAAPQTLQGAIGRGECFTAALEEMSPKQKALWPRPRLVGLILVMIVGVSVPDVVLRLLIWALILFLVASVSIGPERARDVIRIPCQRFARLWGAELAFVWRFVQRQRKRFAS